MSDKIAGYLEVGTNDNGEVIINQFEVTPDANGVHHVVFSPNQARNLARLLDKQAKIAETTGLRAALSEALSK